jgi:UDP-N-acetyl-D-glucosamine dehydrogenase
MDKLEERGAIVSYNDPYIPEIRPSREWSKFAGRKSVLVQSDGYDLLLIATNHDEYRNLDFDSIEIPIVDTRNIAPNAKAFKA